MNLIILPGNSASNKAWTEKIVQAFSSDFNKIYVQHYQHWDMVGEQINFALEMKELKKHMKHLTQYVVIAKSVGCLLTLQAVKEKMVHPLRAVFLGFPATWSRQEGILVDDLIKPYNIPTLCIQNANDPLTTFTDLEHFVKGHEKQNISLHKIERDDHKYENFELLRNIVMPFFKK